METGLHLNHLTLSRMVAAYFMHPTSLVTVLAWLRTLVMEYLMDLVGSKNQAILPFFSFFPWKTFKTRQQFFQIKGLKMKKYYPIWLNDKQ
jgi:hypothetical protein